MEILKIHCSGITKHGDIDYEAVVKLAEGFNGADLRNVCTEVHSALFDPCLHCSPAQLHNGSACKHTVARACLAVKIYLRTAYAQCLCCELVLLHTGRDVCYSR